jgi:hypothetical protein
MMHCAVADGSIAVIQWLRDDHHVQYNSVFIWEAALYNQLAAIQYLRADGCPWDASVCTVAASRSCITLQWLRENGCL